MDIRHAVVACVSLADNWGVLTTSTARNGTIGSVFLAKACVTSFALAGFCFAGYINFSGPRSGAVLSRGVGCVMSALGYIVANKHCGRSVSVDHVCFSATAHVLVSPGGPARSLRLSYYEVAVYYLDTPTGHRLAQAFASDGAPASLKA
ncbi:hypothetical protein HYPSUDRAFT_724496 [Hypholoma sublateritium FD-334 SS-4]|uniref:Uncharacterized protein n=1 Tax=Hypholoma sublateritium (strain FD-334 SS-4) TaxID=945553 RepID=A0A0D2L406_HYPSF|nr:hypothetical protein HYPSUDRAFT_724496 [Hypholoma sublateritium FD-334 SS-4]